METKININTDKFSRPLLNEDDGIELLYNGFIIVDIEFEK